MSEPERELLRQVDEILFRASFSALEGGNADADALITDARVKLMALEARR